MLPHPWDDWPTAIYGLLVPPTKAILATFAAPFAFVPTFSVFWTNESSNIATFAATNKSCVPRDSHGPPVPGLPVVAALLFVDVWSRVAP